MNNDQIFRLVNTLIRKEKEGDTITPEQFSNLLSMCAIEKANSDYSRFQESNVITDSLKSLIRRVYVPFSFGMGDLPENYWHYITSVTGNAKIRQVTSEQYDAFLGSVLMAPSSREPYLKIEKDVIYVLPNTITIILLTFLEKPTPPFYDYYIDANDEYIYLEPEVTYTLQPGEEYRTGVTSGDVVSQSQELPFPEMERTQVIYMLLSKLGIILNEQDAVQYGLQMSQKEELQ